MAHKKMGRHQNGPASYWTPLRNLIVQRDWVAGVTTEEIKRRLDSTDGLPVPLSCIQNRASLWRLRRPAWFVAQKNAANAAQGLLKRSTQASKIVVVPATPIITRPKFPVQRFSMLGGTIRT